VKTPPDPRRYEQAGQSHLASLLAAAASSPASQHSIRAALGQELARLLAENSEHDVRLAAGGALSPSHTRLLLQALDHALMPPSSAAGAPTQMFAIPVLLVTGGSAGAVLPCVVPDVGELVRLFESTGALGRTKNFGLSNALTSLDSLEALPWRTLYRIARGDSPAELGGLDLPPADVVLRSSDEQVALRFLPGAAVAPADTASFVESAGDVGRWGMAFTQALARQLSRNGLTVLPIPRPPTSIPRAAREGRFAHAELAFQLFLSGALRRARMHFGDPDVTVAAFADASVGVRLASPFDRSSVEEYRWPLGPADDLAEVARSIFDLLAEVRLDRITVLDTVQPAVRPD
jgi:hypothetical protein